MKRDNVEITRQKLINVVNDAMKPEPTRLTPQPTFIEVGFDDPIINLLKSLYRYSENRTMKEFREYLNNLIETKVKNYEHEKRIR